MLTWPFCFLTVPETFWFSLQHIRRFAFLTSCSPATSELWFCAHSNFLKLFSSQCGSEYWLNRSTYVVCTMLRVFQFLFAGSCTPVAAYPSEFRWYVFQPNDVIDLDLCTLLSYHASYPLDPIFRVRQSSKRHVGVGVAGQHVCAFHSQCTFAMPKVGRLRVNRSYKFFLLSQTTICEIC